MSCFTNIKDKTSTLGNGHYSYRLLGENNGCVKGACAGVSIYVDSEYSTPGIHDDQEGFFVIEGSGWAKVGDEEFRIVSDTAFIAPAGTAHAIKKDFDSAPVKIFWFHSAV